MTDFQNAYNAWAKTTTGKVVRDFFYTVGSAAVIAGLFELSASLASGETRFEVFWSVFSTGALIGAGKAISLYLGKYR